MKKLVIIGFIFLISIILLNRYYLKNLPCKTDDGGYEVYALWGSSSPINLTNRINSDDCECINEFLIVEKKPIQFTEQQLLDIKRQLPNWAAKNLKNFSKKDKQDLENEIKKISNENFIKSFQYKYTFSLFVGQVPVYRLKIRNVTAYCLNYSYVYDLYDGKYSPKIESKEPFGKKPNYPIIESETWVKTKFGDKGV